MSALQEYARSRNLLWRIVWENTAGSGTHALRVGSLVVGSVYKHNRGYVSNLLLPGVRSRLDTYSYTAGSEEHVLAKAREHVEVSAAAWFTKLENVPTTFYGTNLGEAHAHAR